MISQKSQDLAILGEQTNGLALTVGCLTTFACTPWFIRLDKCSKTRYNALSEWGLVSLMD